MHSPKEFTQSIRCYINAVRDVFDAPSDVYTRVYTLSISSNTYI